MPFESTRPFLTGSPASNALSMSSDTGLTISNHNIGGFHSYYSLSNIINGNPNNQIPLLFVQGSTSSQTITIAGCTGPETDWPTGKCYSNAKLADFGSPYEPVGTLIDLDYWDPCANATQATDYCEYSKTITFTTASALILNSEQMSSGRLQMGMVVYIAEKQQAYQFLIDEYEELYNNAENSTYQTSTGSFENVISAGAQSISVFGGDGGAGDDLIDAWTVHKVEGELKDPNDADKGVWSRDEANWKKYPNVPEYFTINAVPGSEEVDGFNFEDAYIVVPQEWDGKKVVSVEASFFSVPASPNSLSGSCQISLTQTNSDPNASTNTSNVSFDHNKGEKASTLVFSSPLKLIGNSTLHLSVDNPFGSDHKGYTATFKVIS